MLAANTLEVLGQSALDGFDPNANGLIRVVVIQPDGKILLGGDFTTLAPKGGTAVTRNRIARLNPDGTLDATFDPNANSSVYAIAVQMDGKILVGGVFTNIGGQLRNRIARLDATNGLADSFNPNANNAVLSIAVESDGRILAGGDFTSIGGTNRNRLARLDAVTGAADLPFDPNVNSSVWSIVLGAGGKILVGGSFTDIGGQVRNSLARLNPDATLDTNFNPNANGSVRAIGVQADGSIVAGGQFTSIGGQTRNRIARLNPTTGAADSFNPNASSDVRSIAIQPDGKIVAGGFFFTIGGQSRSYIARLNPDGTADSFNPTGSSPVHAVAVQSDGKILAGGQFIGMGGETRNRIVRLETDGRLDRTLNLSIVGDDVYATAVQPDGKILIGGSFSNVLGVTRNNMARLNTDGTLDTAFNPNASGVVLSIAVQADGKILVGGDFFAIGGQFRTGLARLEANGLGDDSINMSTDGAVFSIVVQADGKILVGGNFTGIGGFAGLPRNHIARLDPNTGLPDSFDPNASGLDDFVTSIAVQADGKVLASGFITFIGGQSRLGLARLDATTGLADSFNANANHFVLALLVQPDGKILAGGNFVGTNSIGGQTRNGLARLDAVTGLADSFDPNADIPNPNAAGSIASIALQSDGKVLAGGDFNSIGGQALNHIARLESATGLADSFNANADGRLDSIAVQADGKILASGKFMNMGGQTRHLFARLSNNTAALQNVVVMPTAITWIRGGSSPQFTRVTFEVSTNNVNYAPLGHGTPSPSGHHWTLTGLNLPTGQNLYIRARGFYRSGNLSSSESIQESVRNAFLTQPALPPLLNIQRHGNTNVVLSWATNFPGFTLEASTNLTTNLWSIVTPTPSISGTNNVVTNPISGTARFYRLRQ